LKGVATMIVFIPLNIHIGNKNKKIQVIKQKHTDTRIKMMNEVLAGMKVLKLYGWELSFKQIIGKIRALELKSLKKASVLSIITSFSWSCVPILVTGVSFSTFVLINKENRLDPSTAFVSLTLFNILRFPLSVLPGIISSLIAVSRFLMPN
jgi:ATP-binding cassette, subfamily C (CFTR/MRP), member 1